MSVMPSFYFFLFFLYFLSHFNFLLSLSFSSLSSPPANGRTPLFVFLVAFLQILISLISDLSWRAHGGSTEEAPTYAGAARARAPTAPRRCGPCLRSDAARRRVVQGPPRRQWPRKEEGRGIHGQIHHGPTRTRHGACGSCIFLASPAKTSL